MASADANNNTTNNNVNVNCHNSATGDDNISSFESALAGVWNDLLAIMRAAPDLSSSVKSPDVDLMKFPDQSTEALAQSLVGDVYLSASQGQTDLETIDYHQNRLMELLASALDAWPPNSSTVRI